MFFRGSSVPKTGMYLMDRRRKRFKIAAEAGAGAATGASAPS